MDISDNDDKMDDNNDEDLEIDNNTGSNNGNNVASKPDYSRFAHAYHWQLPYYHKDSTDNTSQQDNDGKDNVPYVTKYAYQKGRELLQLVREIELTADLFEKEDVSNSSTQQSGAGTLNTSDNNNTDETMVDVDEVEDIDVDEEAEETFDDDVQSPSNDDTNNNVISTTRIANSGAKLNAMLKKCGRLQSQLNNLEGLKALNVLTPLEVCEIVLKLLRLITCTITYHKENSSGDDDPESISDKEKVVLHFDNVGYIASSSNQNEQKQANDYVLSSSRQELMNDIHQSFALPSPTRETILVVLLNLLANKTHLRSFSNSSLYVAESNDNSNKLPERHLLILHWQALLRMLLRTAPYLDEHVECDPGLDSSSRQSTTIKRTVQLIRDARHFFDQGLIINDVTNTVHDTAVNKIWNMVSNDVLYHSHTHACYRGTIILYLFTPSRCTSQFYNRVLPLWLQAWTNIDRCPEFDFLWLALFARARKYVTTTSSSSSSSDDDGDDFWNLHLRKRILTHAQYWLQLPIGGASLDKSFPRAGNPRSRSCPTRLKIFAGGLSSYEEGIDFVAKLAKLVAASVGTGRKIVTKKKQNNDKNSIDGIEYKISEGTNDVLRFFTFATPYMNPSNLGEWTFTLGAFLHYFAYELCCRIGYEAGAQVLQRDHPNLQQAVESMMPGVHKNDISPEEIVALLDALLPLCQLALYSKNGHVGRAGESAMLYLVQIDPVHVAPYFLDFAIRALDVTAVNLSHQAPSALSALTRLVQPSLRSNPTILLSRLPEILRLSLAGIDSNDQNKSIRTLILYRSLTSWIPIGGSPESWPRSKSSIEHTDSGDDGFTASDGTLKVGHNLYEALKSRLSCTEYKQAIGRLSAYSVLKQNYNIDTHADDSETLSLALEEASSAMSDWVLEFLDRVYGLLRASGEREKAGKTSAGVAARHTSADVHQARNFSRVLKETLNQTFASMHEDVYKVAVRSVIRFLSEETLPFAGKDASLLCQATAAARMYTKNDGSIEINSFGLDSLIGLLVDDLNHHSPKTVNYRVRCLAGAVRYASVAVLKHKTALTKALQHALSSDDRHVFKSGCKLLRHLLACLCESYPLLSTYMPDIFDHNDNHLSLGRSAQLRDNSIEWHVPTESCIDFAYTLICDHVKSRIETLSSSESDENGNSRSKLFRLNDMASLRQTLRIIRYTIRGGASLLLEPTCKEAINNDCCTPYETAVFRLLENTKADSLDAFMSLRSQLCMLIISLSFAVSSDTLYPDAINNLAEDNPYRKSLFLINSDAKVCKEVSDIALLLLTRRGAFFRSQEARTIWKAQKQLAVDFGLSAEVSYLVEAYQYASVGPFGSGKGLYKDGEDSGKSLTRRLLVSRVQIFYSSLQRNASFEIPRQLRKLANASRTPHTILFQVKTNLSEMLQSMEDALQNKTTHPLYVYEGIIDSLFALCCHSNTKVRAASIGVMDYAMTRFGWLVGARVPRLLSAIALTDPKDNGKFGIPSFAMLVQNLSVQGKRKRLTESVKGVCAILALPRCTKHILNTEKSRMIFAKTICDSDHLVSLLPAEEIQKLVLYIHTLFTPFRSKYYYLPRTSALDEKYHKSMLCHFVDALAEKQLIITDSELKDGDEKGEAHWRKLLLACWFLVTIIDKDDMAKLDHSTVSTIWETCFRIIENESGQPLQKVALGLFGKLVCFSNDARTKEFLQSKLSNETFCKELCQALSYDHKEDTSIGGGHDAQWSTGVLDMLKDASRFVANKSLFPFQRTSQSLGSYKIPHSQLIYLCLQRTDEQTSSLASKHLLQMSLTLAGAPPSEDQKNQQTTSAEVFAGVCRAYIKHSKGDIWDGTIIPFLDDVLVKVPFSLTGAYFDALRYALQFSTPDSFEALTSWLIDKIDSSLWQPHSNIDNSVHESKLDNNQAHATEGFTAQSRWLYLLSAVLVELDDSETPDSCNFQSWFTNALVDDVSIIAAAESINQLAVASTDKTWKLITDKLVCRLLGAVGHPFDSCRDHISRLLFRICYSHRKRVRTNASRAPSRVNSVVDLQSFEQDPGDMIVSKFAKLDSDDWNSFTDKYNAYNTARRFISYCVHLGEAKFEFSDFVIPLLWVSFLALDSTVEDEIKRLPTVSQDENAAKRALEADVIKSFRATLAEISVVSVISYGKPTDIGLVLDVCERASNHDNWHVRHTSAHYLRCFQDAHKFLFSEEHSKRTMLIVANLLSDERREVSSAAMAALTGILAATPASEVSILVNKYSTMASKSRLPRTKASSTDVPMTEEENNMIREKESKRAQNQQTSVFFLCAAVLSQPYETPQYVPQALAAISKHSFERSAPLHVRDTVKRCCAEYKKNHMSDNWEIHRRMFTQEQLEALEDVVSTPHYYA